MIVDGDQGLVILQPDDVVFAEDRQLISQQPRRLQLLTPQAHQHRLAAQVGVE